MRAEWTGSTEVKESTAEKMKELKLMRMLTVVLTLFTVHISVCDAIRSQLRTGTRIMFVYTQLMKLSSQHERDTHRRCSVAKSVAADNSYMVIDHCFVSLRTYSRICEEIAKQQHQQKIPIINRGYSDRVLSIWSHALKMTCTLFVKNNRIFDLRRLNLNGSENIFWRDFVCAKHMRASSI